jgi:hypothetical protein
MNCGEYLECFNQTLVGLKFSKLSKFCVEMRCVECLNNESLLRELTSAHLDCVEPLINRSILEFTSFLIQLSKLDIFVHCM